MEVGALITVRGLVQGVGFRWFVNRHAVTLGLNGYVKNNYDDTVEVDAEGDRSAIEELIKILKVGPRAAQVKDVSISWHEPTGRYLAFTIKG
jgi:acylphosphatase